MRILSYNILDGAEGRADPVAEVIEAQRADIVGLVEADHPEVLDRIARRLKMDVVIAPGNSHSVALLSRWTIVESINHAPLRPGLSKCLLEAIVRNPAGREWPIFVAHLHAHALDADEQRREAELAIILDITARHRQANRPHVLMGDFNSNSPVQKIEALKVKQSTHDEMQQNGGWLPRRVVETLHRNEYLDTLAVARPDAAPTLGTFSTQHPGQRVDYIFTHRVEPWKLKHAWVEQDRLAKYCSDHFPVGVEIET